jgi:transcription elongation factor Elf1
MSGPSVIDHANVSTIVCPSCGDEYLPESPEVAVEDGGVVSCQLCGKRFEVELHLMFTTHPVPDEAGLAEDDER